MAVGNIYEPDHVNSILAAGRADLVRPGPAASDRPDAGRCAPPRHRLSPSGGAAPYLGGKAQLERNLRAKRTGSSHEARTARMRSSPAAAPASAPPSPTRWRRKARASRSSAAAREAGRSAPRNSEGAAVRRRCDRPGRRSRAPSPTARARYGPVTILVNNAGGAECAPFAKTRSPNWRRDARVNLDALSTLRRRHCRICQPVTRPHRQRRHHRRPHGLRLCRSLLRGEARAVGLTRALAPETAKKGRHRQRGLPRLHRHRYRARAHATTSSPRPAARWTRRAPSSPSSIRRAALIHAGGGGGDRSCAVPPDAASITGQAIAIAGGE